MERDDGVWDEGEVGQRVDDGRSRGGFFVWSGRTCDYEGLVVALTW